MVDIHCHILPALDDGAETSSVAREMAAMASADGITHAVATPHSNNRFHFDSELSRHKLDELQREIGGSLTLSLGCELHCNSENLDAVRLDPSRFTINGSQYLLVEFSSKNILPNIDPLLANLLHSGLLPIIAHPERNPLLAADLERIAGWIDAGCLVQVTGGSFLRRFGKRAHESALQMLRRNLVHIVASDAHNTSSRPPLLSEARRTIAADRGEEIAGALCQHNPRAVVDGLPLPWRPAPLPEPRRWFSLWR
jgi:protein-tyrosine phosphatase